MFDLMPFERRERNLFNYLDNMEKNFFGNSLGNFSAIRTDILDKGDHYQLQAELPGFNKEDIKINLEGDCLTIQAEHKEETEEKKKEYVRKERHYGSFARSFDVSGINTSQITADYKDGILTLTLPKTVPTTPSSRQIELK